MNLGVCAILWVGGIQVNVGELTQGQVMAFVNYMTQTLTSIVYVANLVVVFTKRVPARHVSTRCSIASRALRTRATSWSRCPSRVTWQVAPLRFPR